MIRVLLFPARTVIAVGCVVVILAAALPLWWLRDGDRQ